MANGNSSAVPQVNNRTFMQKHWGKLLILFLIVVIVVGVATGVISVRRRRCNGYATVPGGKDKEKGCACATNEECSSKSCPELSAAGAAAGLMRTCA